MTAFSELVAATESDLATTLGGFREEGRRIYATSSFQTQSVPLLHLLSQHAGVSVVLIDTGYLFPETYDFAHDLQGRLGFDLKQVRSTRTYAEQCTSSGALLHTRDVDACCRLNKVEPMESLLGPGDVWVSGIRADQTATRASKPRLETDDRCILRYHPMLKWTARDIYQYLREHGLPKHPLESAGYLSIGCLPCTRKWDGSDARSARWEGSSKTECGLHLKSQ